MTTAGALDALSKMVDVRGDKWAALAILRSAVEDYEALGKRWKELFAALAERNVLWQKALNENAALKEKLGLSNGAWLNEKERREKAEAELASARAFLGVAERILIKNQDTAKEYDDSIKPIVDSYRAALALKEGEK